MLKSIIAGAALSLVSLGAFALPDPFDVSGVELGGDIEEALAVLQERYPDSKPLIKKFWGDKGISSVKIRGDDGNRWTLYAVVDGSGRLGSIYREQYLSSRNVGFDATLEALRGKYGQEDAASTNRAEKFYWAAETADAPADFEMKHAKELNDYSGYLGQRKDPTVEYWENVRAMMSVTLHRHPDNNALLRKMSMSAYAVDDLVDAHVSVKEAERKAAEEERQKALKEAENNAADI